MSSDSLVSLIAAVLAVEESTLSEDSGRASTDGWDSVAHLNVIAAIEETFDVLFSTAEMREVTTVGSLRAALIAKGVAA